MFTENSINRLIATINWRQKKPRVGSGAVELASFPGRVW